MKIMKAKNPSFEGSTHEYTKSKEEFCVSVGAMGDIGRMPFPFHIIVDDARSMLQAKTRRRGEKNRVPWLQKRECQPSGAREAISPEPIPD